MVFVAVACGQAIVRPAKGSLQNTMPHASGVAVQPSTLTTKCTLADGYNYPNLPNKLNLRGRSLPVLRQARNRQEIVAWADTYHLQRVVELWSTDPATKWFLVMGIFSSGPQSWTVFLYNEGGAFAGGRSWNLCFIGAGPLTQRVDDITSIYVDGNKGVLVFGDRNGKILRAVPIKREIAAVRKFGSK